MRIILIDVELTALQGLPYAAWPFYVWLRTRMDGATGKVGAKYQVSWQAVAEALYVEPSPGPKPAFSRSRWSLLRLAQRMERAGVVKMLSNAVQHHLIFKLPLAPVHLLARNKPAPIPHLNPHLDSHRRNPQKPARTPPLEPAPHLVSILPTPATKNRRSLATRAPRAWKVTFPQGYPPEDRAAMLAEGTKHQLDDEQLQLLLDELRNRESKALVRNRAGLFVTMCRQLKQGQFRGTGAKAQRSGGSPLSEEEAVYANEQRRS